MLKKMPRRVICTLMILTLFLPNILQVVPVYAEELTVVATYDFEDETNQGWMPRVNSEQLSVTSDSAKSGDFSLLIENREGTAAGPTLDVTSDISEEHTYELEAWVKLAPGEEPAELLISVQEEPMSGDTHYENISPALTVTDEEWVLLEASYQRDPDITNLHFYVEEPYDPDQTTGVSFYLDDFIIRSSGERVILEIEDITPLKEAYADYFHIGAAIFPGQQTGLHGELLAKHYNMITAENIMKPESLQPVEGQFNFAQADAMIEFAKENDMAVRFHTLVWHSQTPNWFFRDAEGNPMVVDGEVADPDNYETNKQLLLDRMETHIRTVVERYAHDIDSWDVVNEVIEGGGYRKSEYYIMTGTDFIHEAFRITRDELDKQGANGKLYYNDYESQDPTKSRLIYNMAEEMIELGIPIDGIGHQAHMTITWPSIDHLVESIERMASLGLDNQITELDMSIYSSDQQASYGSYDNIPEDVLETQAERYRELFEALRELSDDISSVVFWGIGDDHTWLHNFPVQGRLNAPFVFDHELQAKEAYYAITEFYTPLPQTATPMYNYLLIGGTLVVIGIGYFIFQKKRKTKES
ncbi:endo-1,4-beta-xylanase [Amphibacillus indicireducens]|uniref:Beta-xylanase n=1 Tax=Amphibacillus indicireducens TaxID=1076330 RepID=A0ABP7V6M5_9BACI